MTPGSVLFDTNFRFSDGTFGEKIIVLLNNGDNYPYIIAKTTSKPGRHLWTPWCQIKHRFPNFYLPQGCCHLNKHTWIQLGKYFEYDRSLLIQKHFDGTANIQDILPHQILIDLLNCALQSEDIEDDIEKELQVTLAGLAS
jgi:hypothetical protein